jgi:hypothetical protein
MKRLSPTSILFAAWSIAAAVLPVSAMMRRHDNHVAAGASHFPAIPHSLLGNASILLPLSFPVFAVVFFTWNGFAKKPNPFAIELLVEDDRVANADDRLSRSHGGCGQRVLNRNGNITAPGDRCAVLVPSDFPGNDPFC